MSALPFFILYIFPIMVLFTTINGSLGFFLTPVVVFVVLPLLDLVIGDNTWNPAPQEEVPLAKKVAFRLVTWIFVPVQLILIGWGAYQFSYQNLSILARIGLILSVGIITGGLGITIAHELGHRSSKWERAMSLILLSSVCYGHWQLEHVIGHHKNVATPLDPATAKYNQSFYSFWFQTVVGSFIHSWQLQRARAVRRGHHGVLFNRMLWIIIGQLLLAGFCGLVFNYLAVLFFLAQSIVAFSLLEAVNYIEHYGLIRNKNLNGVFEPVTAKHSWNSCARLSNYILINLQRHSHHHQKAALRYQVLHHLENSPQLPTGYPGMIVVALIPPLWRYLIHSSLDNFVQRSVKWSSKES